MLDNFPHIKAFWPMQSAKLSQVALDWGVDDFDGTVVWYDITRREARGATHQELPVSEIRRLIREAGCEPVERDTLYRRIERRGPTWRPAGDQTDFHPGPLTACGPVAPAADGCVDHSIQRDRPGGAAY
jgi:hypothetical protein